MNHKLIISPVEPRISNYFRDLFDVIDTKPTNSVISYERYHADMQALKIHNSIFIDANSRYLAEKLKDREENLVFCENIGHKYPQNVALNAALIGNKLLCKKSALHPKIKEYCSTQNIKIINVNQGYTKCSTLVLDDNSIITDDDSIFRLSLINNISVLKIEKGDILIDETVEGFIGGASLVYGENVYIFGNIYKHRNASEIQEFIKCKGLNLISINDDTIKDIGGAVII